jgi:hypothetical protein
MRHLIEKGSLIFREYSLGDEAGIFDLMKENWAYLKKGNALEKWKWLYREGPFGEAIIVISEHNAQIVGHYAMIPLKMCIGDKDISGGKAEGSVVHPEYRGNVAERFSPDMNDFRVFKILITDLLRIAEERGIELIWGFPNDAAVKPQMKAGYSHFCFQLNRLTLPLNLKRTRDVHPVFARFSGYFAPAKYAVMAYLKIYGGDRHGPSQNNNMDNSVQIRSIEPQNDSSKINKFFDEFMKENDVVTIRRNMDYLKWRFLDNPIVHHQIIMTESEGKITSMIVVNIKRFNDEVTIGNLVDIIALKDHMDHLDLCLRSSIRYLNDAGAIYIEMWMNDNDIFDRIRPHLKRHGFVLWPRTFDRRGMNMIYKMSGKSMDHDKVRDSRKWYITMAFTEGTS